MNLQTEKLQLIEWLVQLQDMSVIQRIKELQKDAEILAYETSLKPMAVEELIARSRASDEDIAAGRVYDIDEVMREDLAE